MAINLEGIVTWLKGWFYDKTEITGFLNNKANQSDLNTTNGNVTSLQSNKVDKIGGVQQISDNNAHSHINTIANSTQGEINTAIDTAIGNLQSIRAIEVVSDKGTASADKLGKLFIVSESGKVNVWYVKQTGSGSSATYSWEKMDANILDEYVVYWSDVQSKPSVFPPEPHNHGNVHNEGTLYQSPNAIVITNSSSQIIGTDSLSSSKIKDSNAHANIGTSANDTQSAINTAIDSKLISSISLVSKSTDANGKIIFYTGDEPT